MRGEEESPFCVLVGTRSHVAGTGLGQTHLARPEATEVGDARTWEPYRCRQHSVPEPSGHGDETAVLRGHDSPSPDVGQKTEMTRTASPSRRLSRGRRPMTFPRAWLEALESHTANTRRAEVTFQTVRGTELWESRSRPPLPDSPEYLETIPFNIEEVRTRVV